MTTDNKTLADVRDGWPEYLMVRDTGLADDMGGLGQRVFTTAGAGYVKQKYVRADLAECRTLADVQPGGRVRLGDGVKECARRNCKERTGSANADCTGCGGTGYRRECNDPDCAEHGCCGYGKCYVSATDIALSAQPSPGGQDALAALIDQWMARADRHEASALEADSIGGMQMAVAVHEARAAELNAAVHSLKEALAARQPVGEPVAWLVHWSDMPMESPEVTRSASRIAEVSALTNPPRVVPLYAARPAQAVDLGRIRSTVQALLNWIDDWAETPEESGIDAIEIEAAAVLDLIDSQAVGK